MCLINHFRVNIDVAKISFFNEITFAFHLKIHKINDKNTSLWLKIKIFAELFRNGRKLPGIVEISRTSEYIRFIFVQTIILSINITMQQDIHQILRKEADAILNIPVNDQYEKAVDLIIKQVTEKKGKLVTSGMGKAGQIAANIATTFCSTGIPAVFLHPSEAQHGDLGILQPNDVMLLISNSGKTREIIELTGLTHNLYPEIKLIVITGHPDSPLAVEADVFLSTGAPEEVCSLRLTPTTSTTVMTVIGDILVVKTMEKTGFTSIDYAKRHHGGYLGVKSRKQSENGKTC